MNEPPDLSFTLSCRQLMLTFARRFRAVLAWICKHGGGQMQRQSLLLRPVDGLAGSVFGALRAAASSVALHRVAQHLEHRPAAVGEIDRASGWSPGTPGASGGKSAPSSISGRPSARSRRHVRPSPRLRCCPGEEVSPLRSLACLICSSPIGDACRRRRPEIRHAYRSRCRNGNAADRARTADSFKSAGRTPADCAASEVTDAGRGARIQDGVNLSCPFSRTSMLERFEGVICACISTTSGVWVQYAKDCEPAMLRLEAGARCA